LLGGNPTITASQSVSAAGGVIVQPFRSLTLDGGSLSTSALTNNGTFDFKKGTLGITGGSGFTVSSGGALGANVYLGTSVRLNVTATAQISADGVLIIDGGRLDAGILNNFGSLRLNLGVVNVSGAANNTAGAQMFLSDTLSTTGTFANVNGGRITLRDGVGRLAGSGALSNSGLITGDGTIAKALTNNLAGEIRAEAGKTILLSGANGANAGKYNLLGGLLDFTQAQTNGASGQINGHGTLNFAAGLTNSGSMNFSAGLTDVFGVVNLLAGSKLITSGGATTTLYGPVTHNGVEVRTSAGASTVFFGLVNGAGPFTGLGEVFFEGGYSPGNSPASVLLDSGVVFGDENTLTLELGGLTAGSSYDQLVLGESATLALDGTLVLDWLDGFTPQAGQSFDLLDFTPGQLAGGFDEIILADALPAGMSLDTSALLTTGKVIVVPEPGAATLLIAGLAFLGLRRRR
jgi:hypothetical protein